MFASGFRYKCLPGLELSIIAGSSRPKFQVFDVQRPRHRCRGSIDERLLRVVLWRSSLWHVLVKSNANGCSAQNETMKAHPSVSRTLELLAVDMNANLERMLPLDTRLDARIIRESIRLMLTSIRRSRRWTNKSGPRTLPRMRWVPRP